MNFTTQNTKQHNCVPAWRQMAYSWRFWCGSATRLSKLSHFIEVCYRCKGMTKKNRNLKVKCVSTECAQVSKKNGKVKVEKTMLMSRQ